MVTPLLSPRSDSRFDPDEIRRLVQIGKDRGLIRDPGVALGIEKNGEDAAALGPLRSQWMDVDPDTARRWLENNFRNRPLKEDVVTAYARDMLNGVWVPTHQGIAFNDRDELIDGQHRLTAIIQSGVTVRMMVTFGLPSRIDGSEMTTMDAVDRGRTRSVADQLKIQHGMENGALIASVCTSLGNICCGERTRRLSVGQTLEIYRTFEAAVNWIIAHRSRQNGLRAAGVAAGFAFALATEPGFVDGSTVISTMWERLLDGVTEADSPISRLREFLFSPEAKLLTRGCDRALAELVLQAIFLEIHGKKVAKLEISTEGVDYFRGRQPDLVQKIAGMFRMPKGGTD